MNPGFSNCISYFIENMNKQIRNPGFRKVILNKIDQDQAVSNDVALTWLVW